ncbi:MAG: TldD/PmbA family protein [bacterium]|nr:TldD/PmbA family protein [bacterium]
MMEKFKNVAKKIIDSSKADHTEIFLYRVKEDNTRFGESRITQNMAKDITYLTIKVHSGKKTGAVQVTLSEDLKIGELLSRAMDIAKSSVEDPEYVPPVEKQDIPVISRAFRETEELPPHKKAEVLKEIFEDAKKKNLKVAGLFTNGLYQYGVFNSNGLEAYYETTMASFSNTVQTESSSGYARDQAEDVRNLMPKEIYHTAREKALMGQNPRDLEPGQYDVVLEPLAVADFLAFMLWTMDARGADEGITYFSGKLGQKIFDERVNMYSDPMSPLNPSIPFDGDGLLLRRVDWIKHGVLENLYYDRYWAMKQNKKPTGRPFAVIFEDTQKSVGDLIKQVEKGLLVTRFWYIRFVDRKSITITGMTRDGLFYIENGEIKYPVKNFRFNESPARVLANLIDIGKGKRVVGEEASIAMYMPALLVKDFNFSSKTEF